MQADDFLILADSLPEGMLMVASDGEILAINRAALRKLKTGDASKVMGKNLSDLTGLPRDVVITRLKTCSRSRTPVRLALRCVNDHDPLPSCEGFLLTPASDGQSARILLRLNLSENRSDIFLSLNREISKQRLLLRKLEESREQLRQKEEKLAITLNSIGDAVMVTDKDGLLISLNPVAEELTGWLNADAVGKSVKTVFPIIDASTREPIENPVEKVIASGETVFLSNHTTLISKNGKEYQIADSAAPIRDNNGGDIQGMVLVFNDVTEKYQLREANAKSQRNLQAILDNGPAIIYVKDLDGCYLLINRQYEVAFKLRNSDVTGKKDDDILPEDIAGFFRKNDAAVIAEGNAIQTEESVFCNGVLRHYISNKFPLFDSEDKIYAVCGILTDITKRKQAEDFLKKSEEKYSTLFNKSADAILLIDDGKFIDCNQAAIDMLRYPDKQTLLDVHPSELSPPIQEDGVESFVKANMMMSLAYETGCHRFEWIHTRHDGEDFPVEVLLTAIPFEGRELLHVVWRDITERRLIERALSRSQKMDAIGQLTGGIAHDFNNILGIILGNLDLLERQAELDEKSRKRIANISASTQRAITLTRQLLIFSRQESESARAVNINKSIADMQTLMTQSLTPEVEIANHFSSDLWLTEIDQGDFGDVFLNMVLNARDAMQGRGKLTIETRNCVLDEQYCSLHPGVTPGDYVQLSISDDGVGIPAELQERIFEPFFTTKEQGKGTGLGMAMVFAFVKRSGGTIKVYSEVGIGTTFIIFLPRSLNTEDENEVVVNEQSRLPRGSETILVVDDEKELLGLAVETLEGLGYRVLTAEDGLQALDIMSHTPDIALLFSDVVMPGGLNGFELAEQASAMYPEMKVLLTSGFTEKAVARNGQARFKANMLSKPYAQAALAIKLREMLG